MSTKPLITAANYNAIQTKIASLLGPGSGPRGYGQSLVSSQAAPGNEITAQQWTNLRHDIATVKLHQDGQEPSLITTSVGNLIRNINDSPVSQYSTTADQADIARFAIAGNQATVTARGTESYAQSWSQSVSKIVTVTFSSATEARYFFNSGGKIRFTSSRTGGSATAQNNSWSVLLNTVGVFQFGAAIPADVNFYTLTADYQACLNVAASGLYGIEGNFYKIEVKSNVSDNTQGGAWILTFRISWIDGYEDSFPDAPPPDQVDGTLALTVTELKASGSIIPSGAFQIASPGYSFSPFTVQ